MQLCSSLPWGKNPDQLKQSARLWKEDLRFHRIWRVPTSTELGTVCGRAQGVGTLSGGPTRFSRFRRGMRMMRRPSNGLRSRSYPLLTASGRASSPHPKERPTRSTYTTLALTRGRPSWRSCWGSPRKTTRNSWWSSRTGLKGTVWSRLVSFFLSLFSEAPRGVCHTFLFLWSTGAWSALVFFWSPQGWDYKPDHRSEIRASEYWRRDLCRKQGSAYIRQLHLKHGWGRKAPEWIYSDYQIYLVRSSVSILRPY